ncbi:S41 family peptidase [Ruminococcus sp. HUN007]|uniref:S41 family peptidase n=1 Tax=Ruminococcus sp. HUN007 TaxID=1514668 RepID=UPI0005D1EFD6|nr:S41 family peptidase [Ruminococcus sp. HUN007]
MNKKLISALIVAVAVPVIAYFISEDIRCMRYLKEPDEIRHKEVRSVDMSEKDRMKDFDTLWNVVSEGIPAVYAYPDAFGYDIRESEERYREAVRSADDNTEFFCVMQSVLNDVPSAHTGFFFPDYKLITEYNCMASEIVKTDPYLRDTAELWFKEMRHYERKSSAYQFDYTDGEYCFSPDASEAKFSDDRRAYVLKSAGGMEPDEFIRKYLSSSPICFDDGHQIMYRRNIYFNDSRGEKITLELEREDGSVTSADVYYDLCDEYMFVNQPYLHGVYEKPDDIIDIHYADDSKNIVYLRVDDLGNDRGNELYQKIRKYCGGDAPVILDLRNNGGGTIEYTSEYLYAPLFSESLDVHETEYIMKSSGNRDFFRGIYYFMNLKVFGMKKLSNDEAADVYGWLRGRKMFSYDVDMKFTGKSGNDPFVCVLVSDKTASSADYFVSAVKPFENVIVIGENTAGEKTGGQFMAMLPESRLVYYYNAAVCFNDDGTDNSLYGTAPEISCRQSKDGYIMRCAMLDEGKDPYRFGNRLLWDDVLKKAYDICKK